MSRSTAGTLSALKVESEACNLAKTTARTSARHDGCGDGGPPPAATRARMPQRMRLGCGFLNAYDSSSVKATVALTGRVSGWCGRFRASWQTLPTHGCKARSRERCLLSEMTGRLTRSVFRSTERTWSFVGVGSAARSRCPKGRWSTSSVSGWCPSSCTRRTSRTKGLFLSHPGTYRRRLPRSRYKVQPLRRCRRHVNVNGVWATVPEVVPSAWILSEPSAPGVESDGMSQYSLNVGVG